MSWKKPLRNGAPAHLKKDETPKIHILNGDYLMFEDDDIELALFLRKVVPQLLPKIERWRRTIEGGQFGIMEVLEMWREYQSDAGLLFAAHSPRQQPAFIEKIKDDWLEIKALEKQLYEKAVRELERRKAAS